VLLRYGQPPCPFQCCTEIVCTGQSGVGRLGNGRCSTWPYGHPRLFRTLLLGPTPPCCLLPRFVPLTDRPAMLMFASHRGTAALPARSAGKGHPSRPHQMGVQVHAPRPMGPACVTLSLIGPALNTARAWALNSEVPLGKGLETEASPPPTPRGSRGAVEVTGV